MTSSVPEREDQRREWTLWLLVAADMTGDSVAVAGRRLEDAFVGPVPTPSAREASPAYRIPRFEDFLPDEHVWGPHREAVYRVALIVEERAAEIDAEIGKASPRWRLDRMPVVDRTLLRLGVAELLFAERPRPRATINGLIELAKRYGSPTTPGFVNGILDQIRRDHDVPFS